MSLLARALPLCMFALCATAQVQPIYQKMDQAAATFKGLTADAALQHYTQVANEKEDSKGTLTVKRDKTRDYKALFHITEPDPHDMAFSGRTLSIYNPKLGVVQVYDLDKKMGSKVNDYMLLGFGASSKDLLQIYNITVNGPEAVNGQKTTKLVLTPKKPDSGELSKAELWVSNDTGIALKQKFSAIGGDYDLVTYSNMKINPPIPDSAVELKPPRGTRYEHPLK